MKVECNGYIGKPRINCRNRFSNSNHAKSVWTIIIQSRRNYQWTNNKPNKQPINKLRSY